MIRQVKKWIKRTSPFALTKNHHYDILTKEIIKTSCTPGSNCIDVGCHEGEILDMFLKLAPRGNHFAFEPVPYLFEKLLKKYTHAETCRIYNYAISSLEGQTPFNHVISNPAYSGIRKRNYVRKEEKRRNYNRYKKKIRRHNSTDVEN